MRNFILLLLMAGLVGACAGTIPPVTANIPIAVACKAPPILVRPHLPIEDLKANDGADVVIKDFAATVEILKGYAASLEALLNGYR